MGFSGKLKELRVLKGMSQEELGAALKVHKATISKWEAGARTPDLETLNQICEYFGVDISDLLGHPKRQDVNEVAASYRDDKSDIGLMTTVLVRRLIETGIIGPEGTIDDETLERIKEAIKLDAKLSNNLKK